MERTFAFFETGILVCVIWKRPVGELLCAVNEAILRLENEIVGSRG